MGCQEEIKIVCWFEEPSKVHREECRDVTSD